MTKTQRDYHTESPTSLRVPEEIKEFYARLAAQRGTTPHAEMVAALARAAAAGDMGEAA